MIADYLKLKKCGSARSPAALVAVAYATAELFG